jgi:hypothetical protein
VAQFVASYDMVIFGLGPAIRWQFRAQSGSVRFSCADALGTLVHSPGYAPPIGEIFGLVGVHDGTSVRLYANGVQVGSGTPIVGFLPDATAMYAGAAGAANGYLTYYGSGYGLGVPSANDVASWWDMTRGTRRIADMPTVPASRLWEPTEALANVVDSVGGVTLQLGAPLDQTLSATRSPAWG